MKAMNIIEPTMFYLLTKTHKFNKLEVSKALNHKLESTSSNPSTSSELKASLLLEYLLKSSI